MHIRPTETITITDPREFDGDPYQVAERAIQQTRALVALVIDNIEAVSLMARNAELERQLALGTTADELRSAAHAWPNSPQGRRISRLSEALSDAADGLEGLERAVTYNPKARVR
jgi:uncharacterized protein (DUF2384 family)